MEQETQDILLRIGITGDKSVEELTKKNTELLTSFVKIQAEIDKTIQLNKDLKKSTGDHTEEIALNVGKIKELQNANKVNQTQINQNMTLIKAEIGSLSEKRAQLSVMTAAFTKMGETEAKTSEHGIALGKSIKKTSDELKEQEKQIGQTYREVGNYTDSIVKALQQQGLGNTFIGQAVTLYKDLKTEIANNIAKMAEKAAVDKAEKAANDAQMASSKAKIIITDAETVAVESEIVATEALIVAEKTQAAATGGLITTSKIATASAEAQTVATEGQAVATEGAAASTGILNTAFELLLANPVIAVIAAIAAIFFLVKDAIASSEEATNALNEVMAPLKQVFNLILDVVGKVVVEYLKYVKAVEDGVEWVLKFIGVMDKHDSSVQKSMEVEKERQELIKQGRKVNEDIAATEEKVGELRNKVAQKDKYNVQERKGFLQEALDAEKAIAIEKNALAKAELKNLEEQAKLRGHSNEEELKALSDARIKAISVDTEYYASIRRQQKEMATFNLEIQKDREDAAKNKIDAQRAVEDVILAMMKEGQNKEKEELYANYSRAFDDAKDNNKLQLALTDKYYVDKKLIDEKYSDQAQKDAIDSAMKEVEQRIAVVKKGSEEELNLKIDKLNLEEEKELEAAEAKGEDTQLIIQKYQDLETQTRLQHQADLNKKILDNEKLHHQNILAELKLNNQNTLQAELTDALDRQSKLKKTNDETEEQFTSRRLQVANEIKDINAKILSNDLKRLDDYQKISESIFKGLNSLGEIFASNQADLVGFQKALSLVQVAVSTGVAIAKGIEGAMTEHFPLNILAVTSTIATVLANIATAKKTIDGAGSTPKAPKARGFSVGGNVWGDGTGTSDSINARLSHGESVNNAMSSAMFAPIYSALNQAGGGVPIQTVNKSAEVYGENFLANAFMKAAMSMPSPVVSVEEYSRVANRVAVIETLAKQ